MNAPSPEFFSPWTVHPLDRPPLCVAHHSQAKASEDNGRTSAIVSAPVTGEASRASVGAGTDATNSNSPRHLSSSREALTNGPAKVIPLQPSLGHHLSQEPQL